MDTVAIIQARMGSTRLPGKVLMDIAGKPMLQHVIERVKHLFDYHSLIVATTTQVEDDAIEHLCDSIRCRCFRGCADDVLSRYLACAELVQANAIFRITADCPLIDSTLITLTSSTFKKTYWPSYAATDGNCWPNGVDVEIFNMSALRAAHKEAIFPYQRAHVTPYMKEHFDCRWLRPSKMDASHPEMRWTVDTQKDLDFVREVYRRGWNELEVHELISALLSEPDVMAINAHVRQKDVTEC